MPRFAICTGFTQWPGRPSRDLLADLTIQGEDDGMALICRMARQAWEETARALRKAGQSEAEVSTHLATYAARYAEVLNLDTCSVETRLLLHSDGRMEDCPPSPPWGPGNFLAFAGSVKHPMGGARDLIGTTDDQAEAEAGAAATCADMLATSMANLAATCPGLFLSYWWEVVDASTLSVVASGRLEKTL